MHVVHDAVEEHPILLERSCILSSLDSSFGVFARTKFVRVCGSDVL